MPRLVVGHTCGHPFVHYVKGLDPQSRELADLVRWHDWLHSQPCLDCARPPGLTTPESDPAADRLAQAAMASLKGRVAGEPVERLALSGLQASPVFEHAGVSPYQARLIEVLFLHRGRATVADLAQQLDVRPASIAQSVTAMAKKGMVRRVNGGQVVTVDRAAWRLRVSFPAWDRWISAEACQTTHDRV